MADGAERDWLHPLEAIRTTYRGGTLFGAQLTHLERGRATFRLAISAATAGGANGGVHGGIIATLIDVAAVCAVVSACEQGDRARGTAELNVSYLRPAVGRELVASAGVLKKGSTLAVVDVDVLNEGGTLVAKGRVSYALARERP